MLHTWSQRGWRMYCIRNLKINIGSVASMHNFFFLARHCVYIYEVYFQYRSLQEGKGDSCPPPPPPWNFLGGQLNFSIHQFNFSALQNLSLNWRFVYFNLLNTYTLRFATYYTVHFPNCPACDNSALYVSTQLTICLSLHRYCVSQSFAV